MKITVTVSPEPTQRNTVTRIVLYKMEKASTYKPINSKTACFRGKRGGGETLNSLQVRKSYSDKLIKERIHCQSKVFWFCGPIWEDVPINLKNIAAHTVSRTLTP